MEALIEYEFISWLQFVLIDLGAVLLFFLLSRLHVFNKYAKEKSIGFRMFAYLVMIILVVTFLLIRPFYHSLLLLVVFGLFFKNIVSYSRALLSFYFSHVKFGDTISIGNVTGILDNMNYGGIHLLTDKNKVYFPFNMWEENKIVLESESGSVLISFECTDAQQRKEHHSIRDLEKSLFDYPFLADSKVRIDKEADVFRAAVRISNPKFKGGLLSHIERAGFLLNGNKI